MQPGEPKKEQSLWWKYRGFLLTLVSSLTFSISSLLIKYLKNVSPVTVALWRFQGSFLPAIPLVVYHIFCRSKKLSNTTKDSEKGVQNSDALSTPPPSFGRKYKDIFFVLLRSILACNALVLHFYSLKFLELGDALVIFSSTPIFAYALAHFVLREPCGIIPAVTSLTTLMGVVIIIKPPILTGKEEFDMHMLHGAGLAMISMLLSTMSYIALRYVRRVHYSTTMLIFGSWCTLENLVLAILLGVFSLPQGREEWLLAGALAAVTFFGEIAMILALKNEQTGPFALVRSLDVIFGFCGQIIVWHAVPDQYSLIGAGIVISGVALAAIRKYLETLPEENGTRKKFWFMLK